MNVRLVAKLRVMDGKEIHRHNFVVKVAIFRKIRENRGVFMVNSLYSSRKKAGTCTARRAGNIAANTPIPSTVRHTGKKSLNRIEIG